MASALLSTRRWQRLVKAILATSDTCWLCGERGADTVDHVIERANGGAVFDITNLRPAHGRRRPNETCPNAKPCPGNYGRSNRTQRYVSSSW